MVVAVLFAAGDQAPVIALVVIGEFVLEVVGRVSVAPLHIALGMVGFVNWGVAFSFTTIAYVLLVLVPQLLEATYLRFLPL